MKNIFLILALLTTYAVANAQSHTSVQYTMGIPFGDLKDHTKNVSGRGVTIEFHGEITTKISLGTSFGYSCFYDRMPYGSYTDGTATISGIQYRYNNMIPMLVNGQYWLTDGPFKTYVGFGVGTLYNLRNTDMGMYTIEENNWHFLMSPEAGIVFEMNASTGIKLNAKYDSAFKTSDADAFGNLNLSIGFIFF